MVDELYGQMLVAEKVIFNDEAKKHSISTVLNKLIVPTIPSVAIADVYMKIVIPRSKLDMIVGMKASLQVVNEAGILVNDKDLPDIMNYREVDMIPGIDISTNFRFLVLETGIYTYLLYVGENVLASYTLNVVSEESILKGGEKNGGMP
ncbi:hypothetical protein [Paenibacillus puerhi]|uniref:hypothetical protein n=1 Tax=Paenibacillus puerhi TaxID=2692622 RepID=UPI00135A3DEE|nr:hypothetical protein [Paenibacillus puerhi]